MYNFSVKITVPKNVESFIEELAPKEIAKVIYALELLEEFGHALSLPHSRHMKDGLLELRISGTRQIRIFYCYHKTNVVLLHAFIKKSQSTPERDIRTACTYMDLLH